MSPPRATRAAKASAFAAPIAEQIWDMKYRFRGGPGERPGAAAEDGVTTREDADVEATWTRVARALAAAEPVAERAAWEARFYEALEDFKFLPAGRVLAGAGLARKVTLFNCFVMGRIPDDMSGIFDMLKEAALTLQHGGGIGYDFSTIRPKGAPVAGVGSDASGPISFMDVWDAMCRTIMSAGSRRGAMMATLRCDHPDIEDFIDAKSDPARLRNFNVSVLATDAFMAAVAADAPWDLVFEGRINRTVGARALWDRIMRATYDYAEPGVIFIDRVNARNNLYYCETIHATNPCGEQPLPPYGACLLGSVNLARLVQRPFEPDAGVDLERLDALVRVAVRMMDNVVDVSRFALEEQRREAVAKRRIGLGVTGLADALAMTGLRYGSDAAVAETERLLGRVQAAAYSASAALAAEKGAFPLYDRNAYLDGETVRALPEDVRAEIAETGVRNALLTSIAPTGTISLFAGNVSSGIEPIFALSYRREVRQPDGSKREEEVADYAVALHRRLFGADAPLPESFVTAQTLAPEAHLRIQAAAQRHVDSAISKTINLPEDIDFEAFKGVYADAYAMGCKGCTTYRPNAVTGAVLTAQETQAAETPPPEPAAAAPAPAPAGGPGGDVVYMREPIDRPEALLGATYKLRWPESAHAIYITLNDIVVEGRRRPFEVFINSKNMEHYAWTVGLTRMISAVFRRGGDVSFVVEELKAVFDPRGGAWMGGRYVPSILAAIGGVIERHMVEIGFLEPGAALARDPAGDDGAERLAQAAPAAVAAPDPAARGVGDAREDGLAGGACPACGQREMRMIEGCATCGACGYSRCS